MACVNSVIIVLITSMFGVSIAACGLETSDSDDENDITGQDTEGSPHELLGQELTEEESAALGAISVGSTGDCGPPLSKLHPPLINRGGPLMTQLQVYDVRWGNVQNGGQLNNFMRWIASSNYVANLSHEYNGNSKQGKIHRGDFADGFVAPNGGPPKVVHDSDIQKEIEWLIKHGHLPDGGINNAFFIYLPPGVDAIEPGRDHTPSCRKGLKVGCFCAYHTWYQPAHGRKRIYAVMPDLARAPGFCGGPGDDLGDRTVAASHELAEMVTDPALNAWRTPIKNGVIEIGDLCNGSLGERRDHRYRNQSTENWWVQCEYSNKQKGCVDNL